MGSGLATLTLSLAAILAAPAANADTISFDIFAEETIGFAGGPVLVASATGAIPGFARFDRSLGTLDHVAIGLLGSAAAGRFFTGPAALNLYAFQRSELRDAEGTLLATAYVPLGDSGATVPAGETRLVGEGNSFLCSLEIADVARFLGTASLAITVSTHLQVDGRDVTPEQGSMAFRSATVRYTYTPIPEPGSASLLGLAFLGLGLQRRSLRQPAPCNGP